MISNGWTGSLQTLCRIRFGPRMRTAATCAAIGVALVIAMGLLFIFVQATGVRNLILACMLAAAPVPFYVSITLWLDRFEAEPLWMLVVSFIWGATAAALLSLVINQQAGLWLLDGLSPWVEQSNIHALTAMLLAPVSEELAKGAILLILYHWKHHEFDGVIDGIIYAALVGLGFAMTENILYYAQALIDFGPSGLTSTVLLRGLMFPFQHPFFTSFLGIGLGLAAVTHRASVRQLGPWIGLATAITTHVLWNASTLHPHAFVAGYVLFWAPLMVGILLLVAVSLGRESRVISRHLLADVQAGRLTPREHHRLTRLRRRFMHDIRCLLTRGPSTLWASMSFHQVATELAFHRHHVARGRMPADEEKEAAYLAKMEELRRCSQLEPQQAT